MIGTTPRSSSQQQPLLSNQMLLGRSFASVSEAYDQQAQYVLSELGKYLAKLDIEVNAAVSAGLLGGLGAGDLKILQDAHKEELLRTQEISMQQYQEVKQQACLSNLNHQFADAQFSQNQPVLLNSQDHLGFRNQRAPIINEEAFQARFSKLCLGTGFQ
eukprot:TRINITY_DN23382_c0_g1_i1.p1 TRINITY_DN23382_c0_g1~~TRINITY_DN23382_c0_g1_i1.p1  ORF type:complete len:159 (+),score=15.82 TRINITY_DN23382_c0_g1_i1:123-599(+)